MCVPRASQSGASNENITVKGPGAPGTRLPGTDRATVEDIIRQLKKKTNNGKESREGSNTTKKIINLEVKRNKLVNPKLWWGKETI